MCTVIFIPGHNKFQFASLRDENPLRPQAIEPILHTTDRAAFIAPIDALAGGTWAGVNNYGHVIILLNGAYVNHQKQPYYGKSRGLIVKALLQSELPVVDWNLMDLADTEPFTLVVWCYGHLFELVWDGQQQTKTMLDALRPYIWSSATLYNAEIKAYRNQLFHQWMANGLSIDRLRLWDFFNTYKDAANGFIMNRGPQLKTLSYSFIELVANERATFSYHDFIKATLTETDIDFTYSLQHCLTGQCCVL